MSFHTRYVFFICDRADYARDPMTNDAIEYSVFAEPGKSAGELYWWMQNHRELSRRYELWTRNMILCIVDTSSGEILWTATPSEVSA